MELHKHVFIIVGLHWTLKTTVVHKLCKMIPCASALNEVVCDVPFCAKMDDDARHASRSGNYIRKKINNIKYLHIRLF